MPAQAMVSAIARLQTLGFFHMSIFRLVWLYKDVVIVVPSRTGTDPWWKNIHGHQPLSKIDLSYKHFLRWFSNHRLPPWRSKKYRRMLKISQTRHVQKHRTPRMNGAPGEIRTPDHLVRSQVLYPAELRARVIPAEIYNNVTLSPSSFELLLIFSRLHPVFN